MWFLLKGWIIYGVQSVLKLQVVDVSVSLSPSLSPSGSFLSFSPVCSSSSASLLASASLLHTIRFIAHYIMKYMTSLYQANLSQLSYISLWWNKKIYHFVLKEFLTLGLSGLGPILTHPLPDPINLSPLVRLQTNCAWNNLRQLLQHALSATNKARKSI